MRSGNGGWSSWTMRKSAAMGARSKYGGLVDSSSMIVHPTLQMSDANDEPAISITSGATTEYT